jgi:acyl-CoA synthetase (AMP-forming)/AMP-acid ligase II
MASSAQWNFAARLVERLGQGSELVDAASGERFGADELRAVIADFAASFAAAGLRHGDRVLIGCNLRPLGSLAYLGAMFGGLVAVPVTETTLEGSGESLARKTGARAVWTERGIGTDWAARCGLSELEGRPRPTGSDALVPAGCREHDLAALMATSGSTATARLVKVSHGNLIANTEAIIRSQRLRSDERALLILPVSYCFGASVLHTHLYQGGAVVFDSRFMFTDKVLRAITQYGCTSFAGVPTAYQILLRRSNIRTIPLPSLRRFLQAGGALAQAAIEQMHEIVPHAEFFVMYGQTEATARISCLPPERLADKAGSVGKPLDNLTVRIVGADGEDVPAGESGELWVAGESISAGYLDEPEETRRRFRGGWLATGDIASRDEEGFLWITGREGEFVKMCGIRVGFAEIEATVAAVGGVLECGAVAVPHAEGGEALALYVVPATQADDVMTAVRRRLPPRWICDSITLVAELPRNANGKLLRSQLSQLPRPSLTARDGPEGRVRAVEGSQPADESLRT